MESLTGSWLFDDTGSIAVSVQKDDERKILTIVVYDGLVKEAFNYLCEYTSYCFKWFYWYNGCLVFVVGRIDNIRVPQPIIFCFEMNHQQRNMRLIEARLRELKVSISNKNYGPTCPLQPINLGGINYIPFFDVSETSLFLLPADPFSSEMPKQFLIRCPSELLNDTDGPYHLGKYPLSSKGKLCLLKIRNYFGGGGVEYQLDSLIEIDLSKLEDINEKTVDNDQVAAAQDRSAYTQVCFVEECRANAGGKLKYLGFTQIIQTAPDYAFLYLLDNNKLCTGALVIDLQQKKLVKFETEIMKKQKFLETCHMGGQIVRISYGRKNQKKLFCKNVLCISQYSVPTLKNLAKQKLLQGIKPINQSIQKVVERNLNVD